MGQGMEIRLIAVFGAIALIALFIGGQKTYVALENRTVVEMTCSKYLDSHSEASWVKLTDCEYDFDHYAFELDQDGKEMKSVYFALRASDNKTASTHILVRFEDQDTRDVIFAIEHQQKPNYLELQHVQRELQKPVQGLVAEGIDLDSRVKDELAKLDLGLDKDFIVIDRGGSPSLTVGIIAILFGLFAGGASVILLVRRIRTPPPPPPRVVPPPPGMQGYFR